MTETNLTNRNRFDDFFQTDKRVAQCSVALSKEMLNLGGLEPGPRLLKISQQIDLKRKEMADFKWKEYLNSADNEPLLFKIFTAHLLFNHSNEEPNLLDGLVLNGEYNSLAHCFQKTKAKLPLFTYADFLNNQENVAFYELNQKPDGTLDEEYARMRQWQTQMKVKCVNLQFSQFKERLIEKVGSMAQYWEMINSEIGVLKYLFFCANKIRTSEFITILLKLEVLSQDPMPENVNELHESFCRFLDGTTLARALSPESLQLALKNILGGKISNAPVLCWSLIKYKNWLSDVLEKKIDFINLPDLGYEQLFEQIFKECLCKSKKSIADFKTKNPSNSISKDQYKAIIYNELNKLRGEWDGLIYRDYYRFLPDREIVKNDFVNECFLNCFLNTDVEKQVSELSKAVVMDERIKFLENELFQIDKKLILSSLNLVALRHRINDIMSVTIPDHHLTSKLQKAFTRASRSMEDRKPILFIIEDLKESFRKIYKKALDQLKELLDDQPDDKKRFYALWQIKDLEYMQNNAPGNGMDLNECIVNLKNIFKAELDYVQNQQSGKQVNNDCLIEWKPQELKTESHKILAFNYNGIKDDKLALVLIALIKLKAISPLTTLPQLRAIVNGRKVTDPLEWLATQGDLMTFIKETVRVNEQRFTSYNQHWNIAVKCFVKKGGIELFDPQKLRLSKPTLLEEKFKEAARKFK